MSRLLVEMDQPIDKLLRRVVLSGKLIGEVGRFIDLLGRPVGLEARPFDAVEWLIDGIALYY